MVKAYTDIEQSRKLAEILSANSADMRLTFVDNTWNPVWGKADDIYQFQKDYYEPDYTKDDYVDIDEFEPQAVPCWSLTALLGVLPFVDFTTPQLIGTPKTLYRCMYNDDLKSYAYDNPIDTCYEMILKLHELNLL